MSTLKTGKVKTTTIADELDTESTAVTNVINGSAKAWVTYIGFTNIIDESFNVTSVTDVSTGKFTVNFTNPMEDINYCAVGAVGRYSSASNTRFPVQGPALHRESTSSLFVTTGSNTSTVVDSEFYVAIFR